MMLSHRAIKLREDLFNNVRERKNCVSFLEEPNRTKRLQNSGSGTVSSWDMGLFPVKISKGFSICDGPAGLRSDLFHSMPPEGETKIDLLAHGPFSCWQKRTKPSVVYDPGLMPVLQLEFVKVQKKSSWSKLRKHNKTKA